MKTRVATWQDVYIQKKSYKAYQASVYNIVGRYMFNLNSEMGGIYKWVAQNMGYMTFLKQEASCIQ